LVGGARHPGTRDRSATLIWCGSPTCPLSFSGDTYACEPRAVVNIACPVYGFYAGNDEHVNATIPTAQELMKRAGKRYEPMVYGGAGHGFMREGEKPDANEGTRHARDEAWARWKTLLKQLP